MNVASPGSYAVSDTAGDIGLPQEGLFYRDTRHLSRFVLTVNGARSVSRGVYTRGVRAEFDLTDAGGTGLRILRRRSLGGGMVDDLLFTNESEASVEAAVSIECAVDFQDVFAVRGYGSVEGCGEVARTARHDLMRYAYRREGFRREGFRRATEVRVAGAAPNFEPGRVSFVLQLDSGVTKSVRVSVVLEESGEEVRLEQRASLYAGRPELETDWESLRESWGRSLEDLTSLTFDAGGGLLVPAAGAPWFMALFGRDSLIAAYQAMVLTPEPARNALRALASWQAAERDDFTDGEPGKIPHELRQGEAAAFGEVPQTPYYGTADATPLFLILLDEIYRWTADTEFVWEMQEPARRAVAWILEHSDKVDGYVAYQTRSTAGLQNHGWRDSADSMLFRDGTRARGPIAPVEVQGYVYDALLRTARLAGSVWDDADFAQELRVRAANLRDLFNREFWISNRRYYALALDGEGHQINSITSNPGHLLWSGIVPEERARAIMDLLMDDTLFSGWGVRAMAAGEGGYDPDSYHNGSVWPHDNALISQGLQRYGYHREAARIARAILEASVSFDHRLPEVFAGHRRRAGVGPVAYPTSCSPQAWAAGCTPLLVRGVLGLDADRRDLRVIQALQSSFYEA